MAGSMFDYLYRLSCENPDLCETLRAVYRDFPIGARRALSPWIEAQNWSGACGNTPFAQQLFDGLIRQLDETDELEDRPYYRHKFTSEFSANPNRLVEIMADILRREQELLATAEQERLMEQEEDEKEAEIWFPDYSQQIEQLSQELNELHQQLQECDDALQQACFPPSQECSNGGGDSKELMMDFKQAMADRWKELKSKLASLAEILLREVGKFRRIQELVYVKVRPFSMEKNILEKLTDWCGHFGEVIWNEGRQVEARAKDTSLDLQHTMQTLCETFFRQSVIMTKQPSTCVKMTSSKKGSSKEFELGVRILGTQRLQTNFVASVEAASVFSEVQCYNEEQLRNLESINKACDIAWRKDDVKTVSTWTLKLSKVKLKQFNRSTGDKRVCQQRHRIVLNLTIRDSEQTIPLQVCSLPFILNTGANQSCDALGALLWYLFPDSDQSDRCHYRPPFHWAQELPVVTVVKMLDAVMRAISPRRPLREDEMDYLSKRLPGGSVQTDTSSVNIKMETFLFDKMVVTGAREQFPFWKWFAAVTNLIENYILKAWKDGVIHGFIGDQGARSKLKNTPLGTFLLRFSESTAKGDSQNVCGGLVLTVRVPTTIDKTGVSSVLPLGADYFQKSSLADLCRCEFADKHKTGESLKLKTLFDNGRSVRSALSKYTKEESEVTSARYRKFRLVPVVEPETASVEDIGHGSAADRGRVHPQASRQSQTGSGRVCAGFPTGTRAGLIPGSAVPPAQSARHDQRGGTSRVPCSNTSSSSTLTSGLPGSASSAQSQRSFLDSLQESASSRGGLGFPVSVAAPTSASGGQFGGHFGGPAPLPSASSSSAGFPTAGMQGDLTFATGSGGGTDASIPVTSTHHFGPQMVPAPQSPDTVSSFQTPALPQGLQTGGSTEAAAMPQAQHPRSGDQLLQLLPEGTRFGQSVTHPADFTDLEELMHDGANRQEPGLVVQQSEEMDVEGLSQNDANPTWTPMQY